MSYQVIARRWRPQKFSDVIGQEHVTRTLKNAIEQGRLAHAFLFTGPRGVGKTSTARILARAINCTNPERKDAEPCNSCETCQALLEDRELDVVEMDAASYTGVEDIRKINDVARLMPVAGQKKIFIIDEVHMLSKSAFNAFLKTLEEPPEHVIFILATTDVHKVPGTIRSRVQRFDFRPLSPAEIAQHLGHICEVEKWDFDEEALWLIARQADGSLRDGEGLLDQVVSFSGGVAKLNETRDVLGILPQDLLHSATEIISSQAIDEVPQYLESLAKSGADYSALLQELQRYWTDLVFLKQELVVSGKSEEDCARMQEVSGNLQVEDLFRLIRMASKLEDEIKWSMNPRVRFEVSFLRWATIARAVTIQELLSGAAPSPKAAPARKPAPPAKSAAAQKAPEKPASSNGTRPSPAPAAERKPAAKASGDPDLNVLEERWSEIVAVIEKSSPAAAAQADHGWSLDALAGNKLTICPSESGAFFEKQLKDAFPLVTEAIYEVTGWRLTLVAGKAKQAAPKPKAAGGAKSAEGGDLFQSVMNHFGGEEIPGDSIREPK